MGELSGRPFGAPAEVGEWHRWQAGLVLWTAVHDGRRKRRHRADTAFDPGITRGRTAGSVYRQACGTETGLPEALDLTAEKRIQ